MAGQGPADSTKVKVRDIKIKTERPREYESRREHLNIKEDARGSTGGAHAPSTHRSSLWQPSFCAPVSLDEKYKTPEEYCITGIPVESI